NSYSTNQGVTLAVAAPGVLGNDNDIDGDAIRAILVSAAAHGTVALNIDGSFSYVPAAGFSGSDSFSYKANDGAADSNVAVVTIAVAEVNGAPGALNDSYSTNEDTALTIGAPGVLANDTDADSSALRAVLVSGPAHGTLVLNGEDSFTYRASDGTASSDVATVTITVTAVNDAPVASNNTYTKNEDTTLSVGAPGIL